MADHDKLAARATTKAIFAAGMEAAKDAAGDMLMSDEEREAKEAEEAEASKQRRNKRILFGALGLCLVIGLLGMLVSYWHWFLGIGVLGIAALYGRWKWRRRSGQKRVEVEADAVESEAVDEHVAEEEAHRRRAEARAQDARARIEAQAEEEAAVDDELAALKARLKK